MKNIFPSSEYAKYLGVGLQLAGSVLGGFFVGYFIDRKFKTLPAFTLVGCLLGMIVGFVNLISQFSKKNGNK